MFLKKSLAFISLFAGLSAFSQVELKRSAEWALFYEDDKISFYSVTTDCIRPQDGIYAEYVMLRAVNKTSSPVEVIFFTDTYFDGGCTNCDHSIYDRKRTITLQPGESLEGNCEPGLNLGLEVFSKWLKMENKTELSKVKVTEISTSFIK